MVTTEVTQVSWLGRIRESIKGFIVGLGLFVAAFPLLFWNEGRAVRTEKSLNEGAGAVVSIPASEVNSAFEQKLVHLTGRATTDETLTDPEFGVTAPSAIALRRNVEMYQWVEETSTEERKKLGGGSERVTTYSYTKKWSDDAIDSSSFREADAHQNPGSLPFESRLVGAEKVTLGAFTLPVSLVGKMNDYETLSIDGKSLPTDKANLHVHDGTLYLGTNPSSPAIGDTRVIFQVVRPADVSVVSKQAGNSFEAYQASAGMSIEMLRRGVFTAQSMFETALAQNTRMTWILRGLGFFLMFIGLSLFFRPLSVLGDVVPMIGSLLAFGTGLFAFVISAGLSIGTIGMAWIFYRPVLGIALLVLAIAPLVMLAVRGRKRVAARAVTEPATA
ncbi:MAG TPA: TMEM43 family protein [Thermoanaerobaculia bacterium]|nr:TMEM43 family protein [Thermoanaerobaculia bacterium]